MIHRDAFINVISLNMNEHGAFCYKHDFRFCLGQENGRVLLWIEYTFSSTAPLGELEHTLNVRSPVI
jgi:hypothetical protein